MEKHMEAELPLMPTMPDISDFSEEELERFKEEQLECDQIKKRAQKSALEQKMTQYYKKLIDNDIYNVFGPECIRLINEIKPIKKMADAITDEEQGGNDYAFFTINLKPEVNKECNLEAFDDELTSFMKKCKYFKDTYVIYSIEQRSENDTVDGLHAHVFFEKKDVAPSKLQRAFKNKFCPKWCAVTALDYRYIHESRAEEKRQYIMGNKCEPKMAKVARDKLLKDKYNIPQYYEPIPYIPWSQKQAGSKTPFD